MAVHGPSTFDPNVSRQPASPSAAAGASGPARASAKSNPGSANQGHDTFVGGSGQKCSATPTAPNLPVPQAPGGPVSSGKATTPPIEAEPIRLRDLEQLPPDQRRDVLAGRFLMSFKSADLRSVSDLLEKNNIEILRCVNDGDRRIVQCAPSATPCTYQIARKVTEAHLHDLSFIPTGARPVVLTNRTVDGRAQFELLLVTDAHAAEVVDETYTCVDTARYGTGGFFQAKLDGILHSLGLAQQRLCCHTERFFLVAKPANMGQGEFEYRTIACGGPSEALQAGVAPWTACGGIRLNPHGFRGILMRPKAPADLKTAAASIPDYDSLRADYEPLNIYQEPMRETVPMGRWVVDSVGGHAYDIVDLVNMQQQTDNMHFFWSRRQPTSDELGQIVCHASKLGVDMLLPGIQEHGRLKQRHFDLLGGICDRLDDQEFSVDAAGSVKMFGGAYLDALFELEPAVRRLLVIGQSPDPGYRPPFMQPSQLWRDFKDTPEAVTGVPRADAAKTLSHALRQMGNILAKVQHVPPTTVRAHMAKMPDAGTRRSRWARLRSALRHGLTAFVAACRALVHPERWVKPSTQRART